MDRVAAMEINAWMRLVDSLATATEISDWTRRGIREMEAIRPFCPICYVEKLKDERFTFSTVATPGMRWTDDVWVCPSCETRLPPWAAAMLLECISDRTFVVGERYTPGGLHYRTVEAGRIEMG